MEQRTPEWFAARAGKPTASAASKILTSTGKKSTQWKGYLFEVIAERRGHITPPFEPTEAMLEGIRREEESIDSYSFLSGDTVEQVGLIVSDEINASASPDGLIQLPDGKYLGVETKNPKASTYFAERDANKIPSKYIPQVHFSMAVSDGEIDTWKYLCYLPGEDLIIHDAHRDAYTATMRRAVEDFCNEVENKLKTYG
jgi:hypothetical protein